MIKNFFINLAKISLVAWVVWMFIYAFKISRRHIEIFDGHEYVVTPGQYSKDTEHSPSCPCRDKD